MGDVCFYSLQCTKKDARQRGRYTREGQRETGRKGEAPALAAAPAAAPARATPRTVIFSLSLFLSFFSLSQIRTELADKTGRETHNSWLSCLRSGCYNSAPLVLGKQRGARGGRGGGVERKQGARQKTSPAPRQKSKRAETTEGGSGRGREGKKRARAHADGGGGGGGGGKTCLLSWLPAVGRRARVSLRSLPPSRAPRLFRSLFFLPRAPRGSSHGRVVAYSREGGTGGGKKGADG
jgi:hypothetical protein